MFFRTRISLVLAILVSLVLAVPTFAGGWAVITLDELPMDVVAGEPVTIGFTVLQHGQTPMDDLRPIVTAGLYKEQEFIAAAKPEGKPGHYTATLTFPQEGEWNWSIQAFTMDQAMPVLSVAAAAPGAVEPPAASAEPVPSTSTPMFLAGAAALALGLAGAVIGIRRGNNRALALTVVCFLAGAALFVAGARPASAVEAQSKPGADVIEAAADPSLSQVEFGRQLFIAKGCITCHVNTKAASQSEHWTIEMGATNLSNFSASPEVLFIRLKDPSAAKSDTKMPNLDLTETEIEALIAFINSK